MFYDKTEVMEFVENEDVKFIRLAFCDIFGVQKNISIMPTELERAFDEGISFDASSVRGFQTAELSDLLLFPDPTTLNVLPWRPSHGRVVRLFCDIRYPDGRPFEADGRYLLKQAVRKAREQHLTCDFGAEFEFYLLLTDEFGNSTGVPHDNAGYMDVAPEDKGENVRREICLTLEQMGIIPESSHHEEGPGQHEVDFKYGDALTAADNAVTFKWVVRTTAARNGLYASFAPKPISGKSGNGLHINMIPRTTGEESVADAFRAGIMKYINDITLFLNSTPESYERLGEDKAPCYVTWSSQNRAQLIRVPLTQKGEATRIELRSPDCMANLYLVYTLLIYAGLAGIEEKLSSPDALDMSLKQISDTQKSELKRLPLQMDEAVQLMKNSEFVKKHMPQQVIEAFLCM